VNSAGDSYYFLFFPALCDFRNRTPSPPPSSSMKSIPAVSKACRIAASLARVTGISLLLPHALRIVATTTGASLSTDMSDSWLYWLRSSPTVVVPIAERAKQTGRSVSTPVQYAKSNPPGGMQQLGLTHAYRYCRGARCRPRPGSCRLAPQSIQAGSFLDWISDGLIRSAHRLTRSRTRY
jgi:hypothetical protein